MPSVADDEPYDLVVVGTARKRREDGQCEITVTETLFGVLPGPILILRRGPEGRFIFTFQVSNSGYGTLHYSDRRCGGHLPATAANLAGARALSKARLQTMRSPRKASCSSSCPEPSPGRGRRADARSGR